MRQAQTHRIVLADCEPSYEAVEDAIRRVYPDFAGATARYRDDEGDLCTLSRASFPDLLALSPESPAGKRVLRLELPPPVAMEKPAEAERAQEWGADIPKKFLEMGLGIFNAFAQHNYGWKGHGKGECRWMKPKKKLIFTLAQLHAAGCLNAKTVAALAVHSMPELLSHA